MPKPGRLETLTPNQLALRSAVGAAFTSGYILLLRPLLQTVRDEAHPAALRFVLILPALLSLCLAIYFTNRVRVGVRAKTWSAAQLQPLRNLLNHPATLAIQFLCVVLFLGMIIVSFGTGKNQFLSFSGWAFYVIFIFSSNLNSSIRSVEPPAAGLRLGLQGEKPLESQQWGERQGSVSR